MLYRTHKAGGSFAMLVAFHVLRNKGLLLPDVNEVVQLMMMYPAASWGSTALDLDHGISSVKEQTPFNLLCHKVLHLTKPKHRSWQTHSILVTGGFCGLILALIYLGFYKGYKGVEWTYLVLTLVGGVIGIVSHLILDSITTDGVHLIPGIKIRLVPRKSVFGTGTKWEDGIFVLLLLLNTIMLMNLMSFYLFHFDFVIYLLGLLWKFIGGY